MRGSFLLILRNAVRNKRRSLLTIGSLATSLCILGFLYSLYSVLFVGGDESSTAALRLITHHGVSLTEELPISYETKIRKIDGVGAVTSLRWFGGTYKDSRDPNNQFAQFGVEPEQFLKVYPEIKLSPDTVEQFTKLKTAAIAGKELAAKLHWLPGERITVIGREQPAISLEFTLVGTFDASAMTWGDALYFNRDYLQDSLPTGDRRKGMVQQYYTAASSTKDVSRVARTIDSLFAESPAPTLTENERAFMLSFISFIGNVKLFLLAVSSAVTFAIILVAATSISMSVRERTREVGVLKTLGFSSQQVAWLFLGEALLLGAIGALIGCVGAEGLCVALQAAAHKQMALRSLSGITMTPLATLTTLATASIVAATAAAVPVRGAAKANIVDALSYNG